MPRKVVVTAALSGSMTYKDQNPAVPYTPEEFVREARAAADAGAAIVHIHFRDPVTGVPTTEPKIMGEVAQALQENTSLLLNFSTGVSLESTLEERKRPIVHHSPDMASLNPGTMNFCTVNYRDGRILTDKTYLNPLHATVEFATLMKEKRIKPEIECFEPSHIHNTLFFFEHHDFLVAPLHFSFVFGVMGGMRFNSDLVNTCLHAIPAGATWQGIGVGPLSFQVAMASAIHGGHIRVGLEDSIYSDDLTKTKARSNGELVEKAVQIARLANCEIASPAEARALLHLPAKEAAA